MAVIFHKMLNVDLEKGLIGEERLPARWYRDAIGGHGLGMLYLLEDLKLRKPILRDPIVMMTGPLTGTPVPATSIASVLSYRRESRLFKVASLEGKFPAYLKLAGFDGLVLSGSAKEPVRLLISGKETRLFDANTLWGKDVMATEAEIYREGEDVATLAIGPAGEKGNPYATIVADRFVNAGPGVGCDFGLKNLKHISVVADGALEIHGAVGDLIAAVSGYSKNHRRRFRPGEKRRSCFGCVKGCGRYDPEEGFVFFEEDMGKLEALLPRVSHENRYRYYKECLRQGADLFGPALSQGYEVSDRNFESFLAGLISERDEAGKDCVNTRSWEESLLMLNGWYADMDFQYVDSIGEFVIRENAVMAKNCLSVCGRWSVPLEIAATFLESVSGFKSEPQDLLDIGGRFIRQGLRFFRDLDYAKVANGKDSVCKRMLPKVLVDHLVEYLMLRGLNETGYPGD